MALNRQLVTPAKDNPALSERHVSDSAPSETRTAPEDKSLSANRLNNETRTMMEKLDEAVRAERNFIFRHAGAPDSPSPYLKGLHSVPTELFRIPEITVGFLSGVSGGKSSFLNVAICKYPIIPVANTETSTCAVEARRAASRERERIEVCLLTDDKKSLEREPVRVFTKQVFSEALFHELCEYANYLVNHAVLCVDDTLTFFQDETGAFRLNRADWRHCMLLLMMTLDAYIHQDQQGSAEQKESFQKANQMRNALLEQLGIPLNSEYGLRLYWDSERLPQHTVLVDLPGTGGATVTQSEYTSHTELVDHYLEQLSSLICFFDEKATIDAETKQLLSVFIQSNETKGSTSARVIFVLNKADIIDDNAKNNIGNANRKIQTTINSFRESFPSSARYPVYALSTYDGEYTLLDSGISLQNLHHAASFLNFAARIGQPVTEKQTLEQQELRYRRGYPCQMNAESGFTLCHFAQFTDALITEHISRIHFLLAIERFRVHMVTVETIADTIHAQEDLLMIAQNYAPELAQILVEAIRKALADTLEDLLGVFSDLNNEMTRKLQKSVQQMERISQKFLTEYQNLSQSINGKIQYKVSSLQKQRNGTIPITTNILGGNQTGAQNRQSILELGKEIAKIDFMSYFTGAFQMLKDEFDKERALYDNSVENLCNAIADFPKRVIEAMGKSFAQALKQKGLDNVAGYQNALSIAQQTAGRLLTTVCNSYIDRLKKDTAIADTLNNTANRVRGDLLKILSPYANDRFIYSVMNRISKFYLFAADVIDESRLKTLLTERYISDFQNQMEKTLQADIWGATGGDTSQSHIQRMNDALKRFHNSNLSTDATERLKTQVENSCSITDSYIQNPENLEPWKRALEPAAKEAQSFFLESDSVYFSDGVSAYAFFRARYAPYKEDDWAADPIRIADEKAGEACGKAKDLLPHKN